MLLLTFLHSIQPQFCLLTSSLFHVKNKTSHFQMNKDVKLPSQMLQSQQLMFPLLHHISIFQRHAIVVTVAKDLPIDIPQKNWNCVRLRDKLKEYRREVEKLRKWTWSLQMEWFLKCSANKLTDQSSLWTVQILRFQVLDIWCSSRWKTSSKTKSLYVKVAAWCRYVIFIVVKCSEKSFWENKFIWSKLLNRWRNWERLEWWEANNCHRCTDTHVTIG